MSIQEFKSYFKKGEKVRVVDHVKGLSPVFEIKKITYSQDGTTVYLLKSYSSLNTYLYYKTEKSYLEKLN